MGKESETMIGHRLFRLRGLHRLVVIFNFVSLIFFLLSAALHAGEITLVIENTTRVSGIQVESEFRLTNRGTDAASDVSVQAKLFDQEQIISVGKEIPPARAKSDTKSAICKFELPPEAKGEFPIFARITYRDPNGNSFSTVAMAVVRTPAAPKSDLKLNISYDENASSESPVRVELLTSHSSLLASPATIICHIPDDLEVSEQTQKVVLKDGKGQAEFHIKNRTGLAGSRYTVFFTASCEQEGSHYLAYSSTSVPVKDAAEAEIASFPLRYNSPFVIAFFIIGCVAATFLNIWERRRGQVAGGRGQVAGGRLQGKNISELLFDILVILAIEVFILSHLSPQYLLTQTTTTGGDTASHYYTADYLRHELLPRWKIGGWTPGNYAGFPILQFYFPLPFLMMCFLNIFISLQVAFKWMTLLGTFLLPVSAYSMLRSFRCPFPGPAIGAALTLPFLFNTANSMWGGNIPSTLAGEFTYSLSLSLSLIFLGSLYRGCTETRFIIRNAFLVFLVGFSHGYTLLFAEAMSLFFLITPTGFVRRAVYLLKMYALGFFFLAFWLVPLIFFLKYNTAYHIAWVINSIKEVLPEILLPVIILALVSTCGLLFLNWRNRRQKTKDGSENSLIFYLWFGILVAVVMFVAAPKLGVVDIRYVPCGQLMACLLAAMGLGWVGAALKRWGLSWLFLLLLTGATFAWTNHQVGYASGWAKWNYEGFEAKSVWHTYREINRAVSGNFQDPRVIYEHSSEHNAFGTTRAFESLPLFSGRATLEGLYMQASLSSPFIFYLQSEISKEISCPFRQYTCTDMNFERAEKHLELFNVREIILRSPGAKADIRRAQEAGKNYRFKKSIAEYEIWELISHDGRYVVPLKYEPMLYHTADWKTDAYRWFIRDELADQHLVFSENSDAPDTADSERFKILADDMEKVKALSRKNQIDTASCRVEETIRNDEILIKTNWINKPLLVKVSYHPNWRVEGADKVYLISPAFMLIFPNQENVRLYYGTGLPDRLGMMLTALGILILLLNIPLPFGDKNEQKRQSPWSLIAKRFNIPESLEPRLKWNPDPKTRRNIMLCSLAAAFLFVTIASYRIYANDPNRWFNESVKLKDAKRFAEAREGFHRILKEVNPMSGLAADAYYFIAVCYYLENNHTEAIKAFEEMVRQHPDGSRTPEALYHIGVSYLQMRQTQKGIEQLRAITEKYPHSVWTNYSKDRLREHHALDEPASPSPEINEESIQSMMGKAIHLFNQDRIDEAKPLFEQIAERYQQFEGAAQASACLALIYFKKQDYPNTIKYYTQLIERYPAHKLVPESYYHIGLSHERLGDLPKARAAYLEGGKFADMQFGQLSAKRLAELGANPLPEDKKKADKSDLQGQSLRVTD